MIRQNNLDQDATPDRSAVLNPAIEQRGNLLIIEDAFIHSTLIARIANEVGFTTEIVDRYEDACQSLYARQFDCITLDLGLGQHVGCEVLYQLWKIRCKAQIIIISGAEKPICDEAARTGRSLGLNICEPVRKPIDLKVLREMLGHIRMLSEPQKLTDTLSAVS